jgi:hypothetical protein
LIRDGYTLFILIKDPVLRASKAHLVIPVPGSTARIGGLGIVEVREDTGSFLKIITLEASQAFAIIFVRSALVRNRHADLLGIESPSL